MEQLKIAGQIIFPIITLISITYMLLDRKNRTSNSPLNDSNWVFNINEIHAKLRNFINNDNETIISLLGIKYAEELLYRTIPSSGFCFMTERAIYFLGNIYRKKFFFFLKDNVQHKINLSELKAIKTEKLYNIRFILFTPYIFYRFIYMIRLITGVVQENYEYDWISRYLNGETSILKIYFVISILVGPFVLFFALVYGIANLILNTRTLVSIECTSDTFSFPVDVLGEMEIKTFYKDISKIQRNVKNEVPQKNNVSQYQSEQLRGNSKVESLKELSKLYEQELISPKEFERLKKEILEDT